MKHLARHTPPAPQAMTPGRQASPWWAVFRDLRDARAAYGLKARHLTTLAALLTFLPDGDQEMVVFASNRSILDRLNGLCERTFQRHIKDLSEAGLLRRNDSSNGKRFRLRRSAEFTLSYGFDLSPLMEHAFSIAEAAEAERQREAHVAMLRQQIFKCLASLSETTVSSSQEAELRLFLRRGPSVEALQNLLDKLQHTDETHDAPPAELSKKAAKTIELSASNGHFVGHHHKSEKKDIDIELALDTADPKSSQSNGLLEKLRKACPRSSEWLSQGLSTWREILGQMRQLASWIGISGTIYGRAERQNSPETTAATLLAILESAERIKHPAAYFYAVTLGRRAGSFSADRLLNQLATAR